MTDLPYLTGADLRSLVTEADAVGILEEALLAGRIDPEQDSPRLFSPAPGGEFLLMPTGTQEWSGVKVLTIAPDNPSRGKPKIQGVYTLFESGDLAPVALMDGVELTLMRTPATTVLAVKHLLAAGPVVEGPLPVVVFGAGPEAEHHIRCLDAVLGPVEVAVVGRRPEGVTRLVETCTGDGLKVRAGTPDDVRDAAVVLCVTSSSDPVLADDLVPDDAVVAAVGAHGPERGELPPELVRRSDVVVEGRGSAMRESGNLLRARPAEEWIADGPSGLANLADLVAGRVVRRPGHPAVFSGVGMAWEDLVLATAAHRRHLETEPNPSRNE